jgi:hypothetical protein
MIDNREKEIKGKKVIKRGKERYEEIVKQKVKKGRREEKRMNGK